MTPGSSPNSTRGAFILVLWLHLCAPAFATSYYFSPDGHDTSDGRSPGHAWKSLRQVQSAGLKGGDEVLLRRGGVWREILTVPADGSAGNSIVIRAYGDGDPPCIDGGGVGIEISKSFISVRGISVRHSARTDRGAITVWADHNLSDIEISDCDISSNCGRGVWFCGPAASAIHNVTVQNNTFHGNDGSGISLTLADGGRISGNTFTQNCRRAIEPWQAGIRMWSSGVRNLTISDNSIIDQRWNHDRDSSMGIHCDETGDHITIASNKIRNVDHSGIAVENTRGVTVEKNIVIDCNIGIFINRAGHDHIIRGNTVVDSRSQGLAIQGWLAHGVDAQPEITVDGRLLTRNLFENNTSIGSRFGNLKATNGGEEVDAPFGNIFRNNDLGAEHAGFIEWGDRTLDRYDQWPVPGGGSHAK